MSNVQQSVFMNPVRLSRISREAVGKTMSIPQNIMANNSYLLLPCNRISRVGYRNSSDALFLCLRFIAVCFNPKHAEYYLQSNL